MFEINAQVRFNNFYFSMFIVQFFWNMQRGIVMILYLFCNNTPGYQKFPAHIDVQEVGLPSQKTNKIYQAVLFRYFPYLIQ